MQNQIQTCFVNCDLLDKLPSLVLAVLPTAVIIFSYFYVSNIFKKVGEIEENIFMVKDLIDNLEYIMLYQKGAIAQPVLDRFVEKERKPLEAELEYLKMKRQFLLDKIPLLGVLKK